MRYPVLLCAVVLASACVHGRPDENEYAPAGSPRGRTVALTVADAPNSWTSQGVSGELLYTERDALVVLTDTTIVRVPLELMRSYTIFPVPARSRPERDIPATTLPFRRATRYPNPLTGAQLAELIEALGVRWVDLGGRSPPDGELQRFVDEARRGALRFATLDAAIAEGYRRLGPSFPGMGEHWIHPGRIVSGRIEAARPPVLCYVRIDGDARLVSLAYTVPLGPGDSPPDEPFGAAAWHDHANTVAEESLLLVHPGSHHEADGTRLAMVHLWIWPDNPAGVLAQNNWRLPFAVAQLPLEGPPPSADAARGLSLHTAGATYYEKLFVAAADPAPPELETLRRALAEHEERAAAWASQRRRYGHVSATDLATIAEVWSSLWSRLRADLEPGTWDRLAALR